jgi:dolichol-phosphate mannosyltransferase
VRQKIRGDVLDVGPEATLGLSVICPFYNEEQIIGESIRLLLGQLDKIDADLELIVVNDGSRDRSCEIAMEIARDAPKLRVLSYPFNRGRGHALRTGITQARGEILVTTEIDLSWGEDIVERLHRAMQDHPDADMVVASPHLPEGGYRNVPAMRVFFSRFGNWVIRACMANAVTMNTGMTRAYRRDAIRSLPLDEDGKEFHLEVILKANALGYRVHEIPALLEWKEYKHEGNRVQRKSSSRVKKLVVTHSLFSLFANPIRYTWGLAGASLVLSAIFLVWGVIRLAMGLVSVYVGVFSVALAILAVLLFAFGVIAQQGSMTQRELWRLKQEMWRKDSDAVEGREARSAGGSARQTASGGDAARGAGDGRPGR